MWRFVHARWKGCLRFLLGWRNASAKGYRRQAGLCLALPIVWGCVDAYLLPRTAAAGFLACVLFFEERKGKRLMLQTMLFVAWSQWLGMGGKAGMPYPDAIFGSRPATVQADGPGEWSMVEGRVEGFPSRKRKLTFALDTPRGVFRVTTPDTGFPIVPGLRVKIQARPMPPAPPTNPGQFDYPAYLRSQNLEGVLEARSLEAIEGPGPWDRLIAFLRATLERGLDSHVPASQAPLVRAAMLGATDDLDPELVEDFKASGMLHILAISGQHVGLFALILLQVFALLRLPRKAAYLATGALLGLYVPICGGQISVLRAALMFWSCLPSVIWERPGSVLNNLGWAAVASLLWMPRQILSLGFQLSFAATFLLILYSRPMALLTARLRLRNALSLYLISTPALSLVIFLGLYPLLAALVHTAAPSSILGNLVTVGISSGMIVSACLTLLAGPFAPIAACFGESTGGFAALLSASVHRLASWPGAAFSVAALPAGWSLFLGFLVLAFPFALRARKAAPFLLLGIAGFSARWAAAEAWQAWRKPASIAFLDVGQGDGTLCRLPGADILIDAGPPDAGRNVILPYLRAQGINRLDIVVVTHPDLDHYGGLAYVASRIAIGKVIHPGLEADTRAWSDLRATLAERGVPMVAATRGQSLYAAREIGMSVLSPERAGQYSDRNDNSVVTLLALRGRTFLFTGDMGPAAETDLLAHAGEGGGSIRDAVLKVPHHGSDLSNALPFLEEVRPPVAVFSAGRRNRFGHPGPATVEALERLGSRIFLTARDGAVTFACDRTKGNWSTWLTAPADTLGHHGIDSARGPDRKGRKDPRRKNVH
ncbi:MAG: DNA internalization-related competence protein ComEC/Rec2 [Fibrobacteria bacterium]